MRNSRAALWALVLFSGSAAFSWEKPSPTGSVEAADGEALSAPLPAAPAPKPAAPTEEVEIPVSVEGDEEEAAPSQAVAAAAAIPPAAPAREQLDGARLWLFVNDAKKQKVYRGWPLFVKVTLENAGAGTVSLSRDGGWDRRFEIEVKDAKGRLHAWPFRLAPSRLGRALRLDPGEAASLVFVIPGAEMRAKAGEYRLAATVEGLRTADVNVRVADHPQELSDEDERYREKLDALYDAMTGRTRAASAPPAPQVVYVQAPRAEARSGGGAEGLSQILGLVSEFGYQEAIPSFDPSDLAGYADPDYGE